MLVLVAFAATSSAQTPDYYNGSSGNSSNSFPLNSATNKVQWIYDAGMFNSNGTSGTPAFAGLITHVYWRIGGSANSSSNYSNFTIKMAQNVGTQNTWTGTTWNTGMTTVFSQASFQLTGAATNSWVMVQLQTPFVYDPTKSLVFEISTTGGTGNTVAQFTTNGSRRIWGNSTGGSGTGFGTGLVDMGFDIIPLNVDITALNHPATICEKETTSVEVTIKNTDIEPRSNFLVQYKIDGVVQATEQYSNSIPAGQSANYTFTTPIFHDKAGNYVLTANVLGKKSFETMNYTVDPSPIGSFISKGTVFNGTFNSGNALDRDVVADGDEIRYDIEPPTGYNNTDFNTTWDFDFWELVTLNGTQAGSGHTTTNPNGSTNAYSKFVPTMANSDSVYVLRYAIHSISNGCVAPILEREMYVAPRPIAGFTATSACEGAPLQFASTSTIASGSKYHSWSFGDGGSSSKINPSHVYATAGTYTVDLVVTSDYGYTSTISQQVTVFQNPEAEFSVTNVCEGAANPFADASIIPAGIPTYEWNFGDGSAISTSANPTHQYATPGNYTVTMKVTANGCSDIASLPATYAPRAVPDFTIGAVDCNNTDVSFTDASTLSFGTKGYSWDFGDATFGTGPTPKHVYSAFGSIDVTLTVTTDLGCANQITKNIVLKDGPMADFTMSNLCDKDDIDFTNTSIEPATAVTTYEWNFSNGTSYTTTDVTRSFASIGAYDVTLIAFSDNGCQSEKKVSFNVDEEPTAAFFATNVCEGSPVMFQNSTNGNQGNYTSEWDFGGGLTSTVKNPSQVLPVGTNSVTLVVTTPSGCTSDVTKSVTVHALPTLSNLVIASAKDGEGGMDLTADVTPASVGYTILWGDGGREISQASGGAVAANYTYLSDGNYTVQVKLNNNNCNFTETGKASVTRTGVIAVNTSAINAYPNPSNGTFNLDLSNVEGTNPVVRIYAANGAEINASVLLTGNAATIDMSGEAAGVYLVKVMSDSGVYTTRVTLSK